MRTAATSSSATDCVGIARHAGAVVFKKAGLEDRAKALARKGPLSACRAGLIESLPQYNPEAYDLAVDLAKSDSDVAVRRAAMTGMREGADKDPNRQHDNCKLWLELLDTAGLTDRAVWLLAETGVSFGVTCADTWDPMLEKLAARASADAGSSNLNPSGPAQLFGQRRATSEQKAKVLDILKSLVENTANPEDNRASALDYVGARDPDAKTYARRFENDASTKLKESAKRILAKP